MKLTTPVPIRYVNFGIAGRVQVPIGGAEPLRQLIDLQTHPRVNNAASLLRTTNYRN